MRPQTIFRVVKDKTNPFVMMDKRPLENPALSFKAKGILAYLLSRPDGWEVNVPDLVNHSTDGARAIRSGLQELRDAGHMVYSPTRNEKHQITKWVIEVHERPLKVSQNNPLVQQVESDLDDEFADVKPGDQNSYVGNLHQQNLHQQNLHLQNSTQVIKNLSNTELSNKKDAPDGAPPAPPAPQAEKSSSSRKSRTDAQPKGDGVDMLLDQQLLKEPALQVYRRVMRLHVPVAMRQKVVDEVKDLPAWEQCLLHWIGHGWNKQNIIGLLDSYHAGGQTACNQCHSQAFPKRGQAAPAAQPKQERMTQEEIEAFQKLLYGEPAATA